MNLVHVGAEVTGGRKCCLSRKVGEIFDQTEPWNLEDGTCLVTTQQKQQLAISLCKNSQNRHQLNKTHCENLTTYIKIPWNKQHT
jgi:hypothetical protein